MNLFLKLDKKGGSDLVLSFDKSLSINDVIRLKPFKDIRDFFRKDVIGHIVVNVLCKLNFFYDSFLHFTIPPSFCISNICEGH